MNFCVVCRNDNLNIQNNAHLWSADDEQPARVDVYDRPLVEVLGRNDRFDHLGRYLGPQLIQAYLLTMLQWYYDGVYSDRNAGAVLKIVLACDLIGNKTKDIHAL